MRRTSPGRARPRADVPAFALVISLLPGLLVAGCGSNGGGSGEGGPERDQTSSATTPATSSATTQGSAPGGADKGAGGARPQDAKAAPKQSEPTVHASGTQLTAQAFSDLVISAFTRGGSARVEMRTSQAGTTSRGVIDFSTRPSSMRLVTSVDELAGQDTEVILVRDAMYMNMGEASQGKYLRMPLSQDDALLTDLSQLDPVSSFTEYAKAIDTVTAAGPEKVDGTTLRRYDAVVDTGKLLGERATTSDMPSTITHRVWFDDQGRVRRVEVDMGPSGTSTMTYRDWGAKVDIKAPPTSEVMDMPATPQR